LNHQ